MNLIAISYALISAITMGGVYILDAFMSGKTYTRASQPMFISSLFSLLPIPFVIFFFGDDCILPLDICFIAILGGIILALANWVYFWAVFSPEGEVIEKSTELSVYESSAPGLILISMLTLSVLGFEYQEKITTVHIIGAIIIVFSLILFATYGNKFKGEFRWKYRILIIMIPFLSGTYQIMEDRALFLTSQIRPDLSQTSLFLVTSIYFWIGVSSGIAILIFKKERVCFKKQMKIMVKDLKLIILAEILALIAFGTLLGSLNETNVVATAAIAGSFPIFVFLGGLLLIRKGIVAGEDLADKTHLGVKFLAIIMTIVGVTLTIS